MKRLVMFMIVLALPLQAPATVEAAETTVQELAPLLGEWEGTGWMQRGPERATFSSRESVRYALDQTALLIEGQHFAEEDGVRVPVHTALALIRRDGGEGKYSIHSYLSDGRDIESWARWIDGEFQWGFSLPDTAREIRYRVRVVGDHWTEVGETRVGDQDWLTFFEMRLQRSAAAR